ncbi:MAG: glycosyltransferase family 39 protein, partial [Planctomycetia bacterium]
MSQATRNVEQNLRASVTVPAAVVPVLPPAGSFLPVVAVLTAVLPPTAAWLYGEFGANQAWWGLAGWTAATDLQVLPTVDRRVAPPLPAWSTGVALLPPTGNVFWQIALPAYLAAAAGLVTFFRIGRTLEGAGVGLLAWIFFGLNPVWLSAVRDGGPDAFVLFFVLALIWLHVRYLQVREVRPGWTLGTVVAFAGLLLSAGWYALWVPGLLVVGLVSDQAQRTTDFSAALERVGRSDGFHSLLAGTLGGLALALPWLLVG